MKLKGVLLSTLLAVSASQAMAENIARYRVSLADKVKTVYSLNRPDEFLSARSLERRQRQGIQVDSTDLPVCQAYIDSLRIAGGRIISCSKWNNTVVVQLEHALQAERIAAFPFVKDVRKVWVKPDSVFLKDKGRKKEIAEKWEKKDNYYGFAYDQIAVHRGDSLHAAGFRGEGMQVAIIDAGFFNADGMKFFKNLHVSGTRDFVNSRSDIYAEHSHGMKVLSCMAADAPRVLVGTAPKASYWLLRSEDNDTEQLVEEDNWAAAIEFADSVGVDVVNTSLGYYAFDDSTANYRYRDLDGHTSLMTRSAAFAADKGMLVVCSAGNSGADAWKKITPPADADCVLTVGAIDVNGKNASFSSIGNTADGRIKPDVMAVGYQAAVAGTDGNVSYANGTSFSSPVFCGLVTCLWQACPWLSVRQLISIVRQSGDRADCPDNIFGYGVVDIWKAYRLGLAMKKQDGK